MFSFGNKSECDFKPDDTLTRLRVLQKALNFDVMPQTKSARFTEMKIEGGTLFMFPLYKDKEVGVLRCYATGGHMPNHVHEKENEYIIIVSGLFRVKFQNEESKLLRPSDSIVINAGKPHEVWYAEPGIQIAVSIPSAEGFPDA